MKIIAFTGAGISKQSNIPTFMERPDVREKLFRSYAQRHHEEYNEVIRQLKANMNGAKPNDAHYALAEYHIPIITMNIDYLKMMKWILLILYTISQFFMVILRQIINWLMKWYMHYNQEMYF